MRHVSRKIVFVVTAITASVMLAASQTPPAQKPSFEVASVKPVYEAKSFLNAPPGGPFFSATSFTLKWLVCYAYRLRNDEVLGRPAWVNTDLWEIQAKAADGTVPQPSPAADNTKPDAIALMLQSLLEERFQLQLHREHESFRCTSWLWQTADQNSNCLRIKARRMRRRKIFLPTSRGG